MCVCVFGTSMKEKEEDMSFYIVISLLFLISSCLVIKLFQLNLCNFGAQLHIYIWYFNGFIITII